MAKIFIQIGQSIRSDNFPPVSSSNSPLPTNPIKTIFGSDRSLFQIHRKYWRNDNARANHVTRFVLSDWMESIDDQQFLELYFFVNLLVLNFH